MNDCASSIAAQEQVEQVNQWLSEVRSSTLLCQSSIFDIPLGTTQSPIAATFTFDEK